jgi:hypothetical protein
LLENLVASGIDMTALVTASTSAVAPPSKPGAARSIAAAIASIWSAIVSRIALCLGIGQGTLGRGDLLVEISQFGAPGFGAVIDGAHGGFGAIEPGIGGPGHRKPFGAVRFSPSFRFSDAQPLSQLLPRRQLFLQRVLEALDRAELALKKLALKNAMAIPPRLKIIRRIIGRFAPCEN